MKVEGWAIVQDDGEIVFYTHLPDHITTGTSYHMYKATVTYGVKHRKPRKGEVKK